MVARMKAVFDFIIQKIMHGVNSDRGMYAENKYCMLDVYVISIL